MLELTVGIILVYLFVPTVSLLEENCSADWYFTKNILDLIKVYVRNFITWPTNSEVSQREVQEISRFRYCSLFRFHFNYYIIQVSHMKSHVLLFLSTITNNSEVVNYTPNEFINHLFYHYVIWIGHRVLPLIL